MCSVQDPIGPAIKARWPLGGALQDGWLGWTKGGMGCGASAPAKQPPTLTPPSPVSVEPVTSNKTAAPPVGHHCQICKTTAVVRRAPKCTFSRRHRGVVPSTRAKSSGLLGCAANTCFRAARETVCACHCPHRSAAAGHVFYKLGALHGHLPVPKLLHLRPGRGLEGMGGETRKTLKTSDCLPACRA